MHSELYRILQEFGKAMRKVWSFIKTEYTFLEANGRKRTWPQLGPRNLRGQNESPLKVHVKVAFVRYIIFPQRGL